MIDRKDGVEREREEGVRPKLFAWKKPRGRKCKPPMGHISVGALVVHYYFLLHAPCTLPHFASRFSRPPQPQSTSLPFKNSGIHGLGKGRVTTTAICPSYFFFVFQDIKGP